MRSLTVAALALALAACGSGDGGELAAGNSQLSKAQIDAALGPADQSAVEDAISADNLMNDANATAASEDGDEQ